MSYELDYLLPNGTKYVWYPKELSHKHWYCNYSDNTEMTWPTSIVCTVDLINRTYQWRVKVTDWYNVEKILIGNTLVSLDACLAAEEIANKEYIKLYPRWVKQALKNNWKPPA